MAFRRLSWIVIVLAVLALAGCDSFSLTDILTLPNDEGGTSSDSLSCSAASTTVERNGDAVALTVSGGTSPYTFSVAADDLYDGTNTQSIGGVYNQAYEPGGAIGRIQITVTDDAGSTADVYITVVPPTPTLSLYAWTNGDDLKTGVSIYWDYSVSDSSVISGFRIQRSIDGGTFTTWLSPDIDDLTPTLSGTTYTYSTSESYSASGTSSSYSYRVYAVSGDYESIPDEQTI